MVISFKKTCCSPAAVVGFELTGGVHAGTFPSGDLRIQGGGGRVTQPGLMTVSPNLVLPTAVPEPR
jgi:hypothetical protein